MTGIEPQMLTVLEDAVRADPGSPSFAALAEAYRRSGRLAESEQVARQGLECKPEGREGRLVLALTLLDQGRVEKARAELEQLAKHVLLTPDVRASAPSASGREGLSESELDEAFARAETDTDELIDPNRVAEEAVAYVDAGASDGLDEGSDALEPGSAFATATMAQLLEAQGDETGARRIRSALGGARKDESPAPDRATAGAEAPRSSNPRDDASPARHGQKRRDRQLATLERWLANLRGDRS